MGLHVKYNMIYVVKIGISFRSLEYAVVVFVQLALTDCQDAILVF